jgi:hypothetical protein
LAPILPSVPRNIDLYALACKPYKIECAKIKNA